MTTQKEFHALIRKIEEPQIWTEKHWAEISREFTPLAIDRIKRLERAVEWSHDALRATRLQYHDDEKGCTTSCRMACWALEQIKKELRE